MTDPKQKIRIILVSSVLPEPTSAGQLVLFRHLHQSPDFHVEVFGKEPPPGSIFGFMRKVIAKLVRNSRLRETAWAILGGRWMDRSLPRSIDNQFPTVVLTVAHGDGYLAAMRFARKHELPLVTIFHDWWPALCHALFPVNFLVGRQFRNLYRQSTINLPVSEGMKERLGPHPDTRLLYPIPELPPPPKQQVQSDKRFKLIYFGNLGVYADLVAQATNNLLQKPEIHFEMRGIGEGWKPEYKTELKRKGVLLDYAPRKEFQEWLESADAILVPQSFDESRRIEMETNFPSKLVEASQIRRPIIVWAPPWASGAVWASKNSTAMCVQDPAPAALVEAVVQLSLTPNLRKELAQAISTAADRDFSPKLLQAQFYAAIRKAATQ